MFKTFLLICLLAIPTPSAWAVLHGTPVPPTDVISKSVVNLYVPLNSVEQLCTGIVIEHGIILTAAHCVEHVSSISFLPAFTKQYIATLGYSVPKIRKMPAKGDTDDNDVALVYYTVTEELKKILVPYNIIPDPAAFPGIKARLKFYGYGTPGIETVGQAILTSYVTSEGEFYRDAITTLQNSKGQRTTRGDSGGPLFWVDEKDVPIGLIGALSREGSSSNVLLYKVWINDQLKKLEQGDTSDILQPNPYRTVGSYHYPNAAIEAEFESYFNTVLSEAFQTRLPGDCDVVLKPSFIKMFGEKMMTAFSKYGAVRILARDVFIESENGIDTITNAGPDDSHLEIKVDRLNKKIISLQKWRFATSGFKQEANCQ